MLQACRGVTGASVYMEKTASSGRTFSEHPQHRQGTVKNHSGIYLLSARNAAHKRTMYIKIVFQKNRAAPSNYASKCSNSPAACIASCLRRKPVFFFSPARSIRIRSIGSRVSAAIYSSSTVDEEALVYPSFALDFFLGRVDSLCRRQFLLLALPFLLDLSIRRQGGRFPTAASKRASEHACVQ